MTKNEHKLRFYISGRISGTDIDEARERFDAAAQLMSSIDIEPVNPFDNGLPDSASWNEHMARDFEMLLPCDGIFMLAGWYDSKGAAIEHYTAVQTGKYRLYEDSVIAMDEEVATSEHARDIERIAHAVCNVCGVSFDELRGHLRTAQLTFARMLFAFRACNTGLSRTQVGNLIHRDHSTISYFYKRHRDEERFNPFFKSRSKEVDLFLAERSLNMKRTPKNTKRDE